MNRQVAGVAAVAAALLIAALASPGHALVLALGLAAGPRLARFLAREEGAGPLRSGDPPTDETGSVAAVIDALNHPVLLVDRRACVVLANASALIAFPGVQAGAPLSLAIRDPGVLDAVGAAIASGLGRQADLIERAPVERAFACAVEALSRKPRGAAAVLSMRETSKELAVESMRVDFVANASHELRTPLASILGFIETLQGPARNDAPAREKFLAVMAEQARRMARLVDDLLSLSRIELREHIAPTTRADMGVIVDRTALSLAEFARERGVEIAIERRAAETVVVGDGDELTSVMDNLIENAIKYGKAGGRVAITLMDGAGAGELAVEVRDFGGGVAPEHLPRLTERFYRVDSALSRAEGGTGLGLALVKHTVSRHRGRLSIQSVAGEGAAFTVTLPRAASGGAPS